MQPAQQCSKIFHLIPQATNFQKTASEKADDEKFPLLTEQKSTGFNIFFLLPSLSLFFYPLLSIHFLQNTSFTA